MGLIARSHKVVLASLRGSEGVKEEAGYLSPVKFRTYTLSLQSVCVTKPNTHQKGKELSFIS
jgi:hypothetical protein